MKCNLCQSEEDVKRIFDTTLGNKIYLCKKCRKDWDELGGNEIESEEA